MLYVFRYCLFVLYGSSTACFILPRRLRQLDLNRFAVRQSRIAISIGRSTVYSPVGHRGSAFGLPAEAPIPSWHHCCSLHLRIWPLHWLLALLSCPHLVLCHFIHFHQQT